MRIPSDALAGSTQATIEVARQEGGRFKATCPSIPALPEVWADEESWAIQKMAEQVRDYYFRGLPGHGG